IASLSLPCRLARYPPFPYTTLFRSQDPAVGQIVMVGAAALYCKDRAEKGERRTEVAGHLAAGDKQEDQRRDSAEEDDRIGIETEDQGNQHRGAEHRHHVL